MGSVFYTQAHTISPCFRHTKARTIQIYPGKEYVPFVLKHYGNISSITFQKDNYEPHRAKSVTAYIEARCMNVMKWPARSPDLNPIVNAWSMLKRRLRRRSRFPKNTREFFYYLQEEWMAIPDAYYKTLVRSMATKSNLVKMNRGESTKY